MSLFKYIYQNDLKNVLSTIDTIGKNKRGRSSGIYYITACAKYKASVEIARELIKAGCDQILYKDFTGKNAMEYAIENNCIQLVELFSSIPYIMDLRPESFMCIKLAIDRNNIDALKALLQLDSNQENARYQRYLSKPGINGKTIIEYVALQGKGELFCALLEYINYMIYGPYMTNVLSALIDKREYELMSKYIYALDEFDIVNMISFDKLITYASFRDEVCTDYLIQLVSEIYD